MNLTNIKAQFAPLPIIPPSLTSQTIIITGANTGLGLEAARHFVRLGASRVILAVRSPAKGAAALASIEASTGRTGVAHVWPLDLASNASIRAFAARADAELDRIDAVVENAGVARVGWEEAEGTEATVQVNVIGTFLLAVLLLPGLRRSAEKWGTVPHLTVLTSGLHAVAKFAEGEEEDIFAALASRSEENMTDRYNVSKLLEVYAVRELAKLLPVAESGVVINMLNPGLCTTELARDVGFLYKLQIGLLRMVMGRSAEEGSRTLLHAAVAGVESHGKYCSECEIKDDLVAPFVKDEKGQRLQRKVWDQLAAKLESIEPGCVGRIL